MPRPSHPPRRDYSNYTWRRVQITKLLVMQLSEPCSQTPSVYEPMSWWAYFCNPVRICGLGTLAVNLGTGLGHIIVMIEEEECRIARLPVSHDLTTEMYAIYVCVCVWWGILPDRIREQKPPLWSSGQSYRATDPDVRVRFPLLPDFLRSNGSGTGSTQPREYRLQSRKPRIRP
jgi:hypothetical protein